MVGLFCATSDLLHFLFPFNPSFPGDASLRSCCPSTVLYPTSWLHPERRRRGSVRFCIGGRCSAGLSGRFSVHRRATGPACPDLFSWPLAQPASKQPTQPACGTVLCVPLWEAYSARRPCHTHLCSLKVGSCSVLSDCSANLQPQCRLPLPVLVPSLLFFICLASIVHRPSFIIHHHFLLAVLHQFLSSFPRTLPSTPGGFGLFLQPRHCRGMPTSLCICPPHLHTQRPS